MRENAKYVRQVVVDVSDAKVDPDDVSDYLMRLELDWPREVGTRMRAAQTAALTIEEAKAQEAR